MMNKLVSPPSNYTIRHPYHLFIDGTWAAPTSPDRLDVISPFNEEVTAQVASASEADINRAVASARRAFDTGSWPRFSGKERAEALRRLASILRTRSNEIAWATTMEMGTTLAQAKWMTEFSIDLFAYYAGVAESYPYEEVRPRSDGGYGVIAHEPAGVAALIVPWNAPPLTTAMKLAPALGAGCTVVLKPASETPLDAYILAECVEQACLPAGVFNLVVADRGTSSHLAQHPSVDLLSFTGSSVVGRQILAAASTRIARTCLELGGKSAAIVLDDADPSEVIPHLLSELISNCGQSCSSFTRFIVPRKKRIDYAEALSAAAQKVCIGHPLDSATQMGPLAMKRQHDRVQGYIAKGRSEGANLVSGGVMPRGLDKGYYIEPAIFVDVENHMTIAREEIFGPVSSIIAHDGPDDAVRIANDSIYGLHGAVFTRDLDAAYAIARRLRTGQVGCNSKRVIDVSLPMGGFKQSGIGRERGIEGFEHYLETKTLYLDRPPTHLIA